MDLIQGSPLGHVTSPLVTGGCIIGLRYKHGVVLAADNVLAYGTLLSRLRDAEYDDVCRYETVSPKVVVAATGEYADFQEAVRILRELNKESEIFEDGVEYSPEECSSYLAKMSYKRRSDMNPFFNSFVVAGFGEQGPHLATVDVHGARIVKDYAVAGFAKHFGLALIANEWSPEMSLEDCKRLLSACFSVIFQRVCITSNFLQFAVVNQDGVRVEAPQRIESNWRFKHFVQKKNELLWL